MAMEGKTSSKTPIGTFHMFVCLAKKLCSIEQAQTIPRLSDLSLLNKCIIGLHIANCALGFEFLFPNDVGILDSWLGIFTKIK